MLLSIVIDNQTNGHENYMDATTLWNGYHLVFAALICGK